VTEGEELPEAVLAAYERAASTGFRLACEADVGRLLAALAAAVPAGGRVLEIGTGVGVGLAWLVHGLGPRQDVAVVTVELDDVVQQTALAARWPPWVGFESGDGAEVVGRLGQFDLIFADAPGGKIFKLRRTVAALREGGVIVVDDMDLARHADEQLRSALVVVRHRLLENAELVCAELGFSSGVIVAVNAGRDLPGAARQGTFAAAATPGRRIWTRIPPGVVRTQRRTSHCALRMLRQDH
jgi:predicted O-methyltransferase YrrM